jgi:lipopolysaccharide/colanic/teichoic acid biosynthesis glycosyltransferase
MILKFLFDRIVALIGLLILWPVLLVVVILVKIKMPGGPVFFCTEESGPWRQVVRLSQIPYDEGAISHRKHR